MNRSKRDEIAARAHQIWEQEGRPPDKAEEHWRRAEQEVARQEQPEQMGGAGERAPERTVDTRPAPPIDAAPPLDGTADTADDAAAKKPKTKTGRSRRTRGEPQQR